MTKNQTKSVRARRAEYQAQQNERAAGDALGIVGGLIALAVLVAFVLQRPAIAPEDVVLPDSLESPPNADGKAWGPVDAPVVIEEFSDFQ